jgi:large subunit ribosomal protein L29
MKYNEIADLATDELKEKLEMERERLTKMKINHTVSPLENPKSLTATRKDIARIMTELRKREIESSKA